MDFVDKKEQELARTIFLNVAKPQKANGEHRRASTLTANVLAQKPEDIHWKLLVHGFFNSSYLPYENGDYLSADRVSVTYRVGRELEILHALHESQQPEATALVGGLFQGFFEDKKKKGSRQPKDDTSKYLRIGYCLGRAARE